MAEFPELGRNCQVSFCNKLDFLPFICSTCNGTFCVDHRAWNGHGCAPQSCEVDLSNPANPISKPCSFSGCSKVELFDVVCTHCSKQYCLQHRHPQDHSCLPFESAKNKSTVTQTQVLNQKYQELSVTHIPQGKGHKSEATAAKVRLMKLKMKAIGEQGIPQEDKVFFMVEMPQRHTKTAVDCYFSKHWAVGKVIDWLAKTEKLTNNNHNPAAEQLRLFSGVEPLLPLSDAVSLFLTRGTIVSGGILRLEYMSGG